MHIIIVPDEFYPIIYSLVKDLKNRTCMHALIYILKS